MDAMDVHDRQLLLFHRLAARRLRSRPALAKHARLYLSHIRSRWGVREVEQWEQLLALPIDEACRRLSSRSDVMVDMRLSSPLRFMPEFELRDASDRRRLYVAALRFTDQYGPVRPLACARAADRGGF